MTEEEQIAACKAIAASCMWGNSGLASVIIERLDKAIPCDPTWRQVYDANAKAAKRESVGVLSDEKTLKWMLQRGYWLTNWNEDGCCLFNPPPMNGLSQYVSKELAEKYRSDRWPFFVEPITPDRVSSP